MELFDVLKKDHNQVKVLCRRIQTAGGSSSSGKRMFLELTSMVEVHMQAEEHLFYARLQENKETMKYALEGYEEHRLAKLLLDELKDELKTQSLGTEAWDVKFKVFTDVITHHIEEEEETFFEKGEEIFEDDELEELGAIFNEQKQQLLATPRRPARKTSRPAKAQRSARSQRRGSRRRAA